MITVVTSNSFEHRANNETRLVIHCISITMGVKELKQNNAIFTEQLYLSLYQLERVSFNKIIS